MINGDIKRLVKRFKVRQFYTKPELLSSSDIKQILRLTEVYREGKWIFSFLAHVKQMLALSERKNQECSLARSWFMTIWSCCAKTASTRISKLLEKEVIHELEMPDQSMGTCRLYRINWSFRRKGQFATYEEGLLSVFTNKELMQIFPSKHIRTAIRSSARSAA